MKFYTLDQIPEPSKNIELEGMSDDILIFEKNEELGVHYSVKGFYDFSLNRFMHEGPHPEPIEKVLSTPYYWCYVPDLKQYLKENEI